MADRRQNNDHDTLIEVKTKVDLIIEKVDTLTNTIVARVDDLETNVSTNNQKIAKLEENDKDKEERIRFIEKYVWGVIAIIGVLNFIGLGGLILLATKLLSH